MTAYFSLDTVPPELLIVPSQCKYGAQFTKYLTIYREHRKYITYCIGNFLKFRQAETREQTGIHTNTHTYRQTDRQTDMLIAILCTVPGRSNNSANNFTYA